MTTMTDFLENKIIIPTEEYNVLLRIANTADSLVKAHQEKNQNNVSYWASSLKEMIKEAKNINAIL